MSSRWTHNICDECWYKRCVEKNEHGREPVRVLPPYNEGRCCFCGLDNDGGIYTREDPESLMCKGKHDTD